MDYQKVIEQARTCIGPYCKACAVCNRQSVQKYKPGPLERKESEMWRSEIFRNGRRSVSIWIRSVKRSRLIRQ